MRLSDVQIAVVASQAGFTGSDLATAVAVALAESGGDTNATNNNRNGSTDYGLFQINSVHSDLLGTGTWSNPSDNARMAFSVWHGSGWTAWTTYNTGKYLLFISRGRAAASAAANAGITVPVVATAASKQVPNPPFPASGKAQGGREPYVTVRGVKYNIFTKRGDGYNPKLNAIFPSDIDKMIAWGDAAKHADPDKYDSWPFGQGNAYKHGSKAYRNSLNNKGSICQVYALVYDPPRSVGTLPGEGTVTNGLSSLVDLIKFITNPHNWIRLAFFVIGGALVLFAAYKVSGVSVPSAALKVAEVVK